MSLYQDSAQRNRKAFRQKLFARGVAVWKVETDINGIIVHSSFFEHTHGSTNCPKTAEYAVWPAVWRSVASREIHHPDHIKEA